MRLTGVIALLSVVLLTPSASPKSSPRMLGLVDSPLSATPVSAAAGYDPAGTYLPWSAPVDQPTDANGIPIVDYGDDIGIQYNPGTIALYGLLFYNDWVSDQDRPSLDTAIRMADWLVQAQHVDGAWHYGFDWPLPNTEASLEAPWPSAYAQGVALSLLTRVYRVTGNPKYLPTIRAALRPFQRLPSNDGVRTRFLGYTAYDEYPWTRPTLALNGFQAALVGLYDTATLLAERGRNGQLARQLFADGMEGLRFLLPFYESGGCQQFYWLLHLTVRSAPFELGLGSPYFGVHVYYLEILNAIAPGRRIAYFLGAWRQHLADPACSP